MKLATKLVVPQLSLLFLVAGVAVLQVWYLTGEQRALEQTTTRLQQVGARLQALSQVYADRERDLLSYSLRPTEARARRVEDGSALIAQALHRLRGETWLQDEAVLVEDLLRSEGTMGGMQERFLVETRAGAREAAQRAFIGWWFVAQRANAMLADLSAFNFKRMDEAMMGRRRAQRRVDLGVLGVMLLGAALVGAYAAYVLRGVVRPLEALTGATRRVGGEGGDGVPRFVDRDDEIGTLSATISDMTERLTAANAHLADALASRDRFLSVAAHELKTPLTALMLQAEVLQRGVKGRGPAERVLRSADAMDRQVRRIGALIDVLLDVSRIRSGKLALEPRDEAIADVVRDAVAGISELLDRGESTIEVDVQEGLRCVVDRSRIEQVLVNLVGNAVKYAPGAAIRVSARREGDAVVLRVRDRGPGIPESVRATVFDAYVRAEGSTQPGLGLGLFICKQIVEAHGGTIAAESPPDGGTEVVVRLPAAASTG